MYQLITFLTDFFINKPESIVINKPLLFTVIGIFVVALFICILITRKNQLYINSSKKKKNLEKFHKEEVV